MRSVFAKNPTFSQFNDWDTQIQTMYFCLTELYLVLKHWRVVYAILLLRWSIVCFITLLSYASKFYITALYPSLTQCWGKPYLITLLGNSIFQYIAELHPFLVHCWTMNRPNILLSTSAKRCIQPISFEYYVNQEHSQKLQTDKLIPTCTYLGTIETIDLKQNPVDQSSCNSFSRLNHEYHVCKKVPWVVESQKRSTYTKKSVEWLHIWLLFK